MLSHDEQEKRIHPNAILTSSCEPTEVAGLRAEAVTQHVGARGVSSSTARPFAMQTLNQAPCLEDSGGLAERCASRWTGDSCIVMNGHHLKREGPTVFCEVCVAWSG